jgi:ComF family protein
VHSLKYAGLKSAAEEMAGLIEAGLGKSLLELLNPQNTLIVPAPLHPQRLQRRGFNQSDLLAIRIAEKMGPEWRAKRVLKRIKNNKSQTECKNKKERFKNVSGIFEVTEKLAGLDIVLVDDVFTSGATTREMMRTLKAAGAGRLIAVVFAEA